MKRFSFVIAIDAVGDGVNVPEALNDQDARRRFFAGGDSCGLNAGARGLVSRRSPRAWHAARDMCETWEALAPPRCEPGYAKRRIGAEQMGIKSRESDRFIVV